MTASQLENERQSLLRLQASRVHLSLLRLQASRLHLTRGWGPEDEAILRARLELCESYLARARRRSFKVPRP